MKEKYVSREILYNLYIKKNLSTRQVGEILGLVNSTVLTKLKKYRIETRTGIVWNKSKTKKDYPQLRGNTTINRIPWNKGLTKDTDERVKQQSETYKKTHKDFLGNKNPFFGKEHSEETKRIMSLKKGGTGVPGENSEYGPEFNDKLKEKIRKRDNYICQLTGLTEEENLMIYGRVLDVHHIDYNKLNNKENNLISLSYESHKRTNYNREYWNRYFTKIMEIK